MAVEQGTPIHCPFCGPGQSMVDYYQDNGYHKVGCGRCGSHSGSVPKSDTNGKSRVIALWNTRPMEATAPSVLVQRPYYAQESIIQKIQDRWAKNRGEYRDISIRTVLDYYFDELRKEHGVEQ